MNLSLILNCEIRSLPSNEAASIKSITIHEPPMINNIIVEGLKDTHGYRESKMHDEEASLRFYLAGLGDSLLFGNLGKYVINP